MTDEYPDSFDQLTWEHHVVHYTFFPMLLFVFGMIAASMPLWYVGYIDFVSALVVPWVGLWLMTVYIHYFGEAVIPRETYNRHRGGAQVCQTPNEDPRGGSNDG